MRSDFSQYRINTILKKLNIIGVQPLDVLIVGATGAGKSTTLNTILQNEEATVGYGVEPETMDWNCQEMCSRRIPKILDRQESGSVVSQPS